jgi:hypothetical protein
MRRRLCIKSPTRGSKCNPIYVVKVRPKVQRPNPLPAKILDPTQIGISGLEEIFCLASISAAGLAGRVLSPALPRIWRRGWGPPDGAGIAPRTCGGAESPITFNMLLTLRITRTRIGPQPSFGHRRACPRLVTGHPNNRTMCPAPPTLPGKPGEGRWGRASPAMTP